MYLGEQDYEGIACEAIRNYLNKDIKNEIILSRYKFAVLRIIAKAKILIEKETDSLGVKSIKEGDSSLTFNETSAPFLIDSEIQALLPAPYVRMH